VTRWAPALLFSVLAACASEDPAPPREAPRDAAAVAPVVEMRDEEEVPADAAVAGDAGVAPADALRRGRELAQQQKWREAIAALEPAANGGDATALAELAFTAALAGDDVRTERAARAVAARSDVDEPQRATAYYHLGRALELRGDVEGARAAYAQSLEVKKSTAVADRAARLAPRKPPPVPAPAACAEPRPTGEVCACLATELGVTSGAAGARCVASHRHGGDAWALTLVARDQAPTFLVAGAGKGRARVLAALGVVTPGADAEPTITRWNVLRGPGGASLVRVDTRMSGRDAAGRPRTLREDAVVCVTGATARCVALLPVVERVGTPAVQRRLDVTIDATDEQGVARVTVIEGPSAPADVLGAHRLW
jgi:hypothetical protein